MQRCADSAPDTNINAWRGAYVRSGFLFIYFIHLNGEEEEE